MISVSSSIAGRVLMTEGAGFIGEASVVAHLYCFLELGFSFDFLNWSGSVEESHRATAGREGKERKEGEVQRGGATIVRGGYEAEDSDPFAGGMGVMTTRLWRCGDGGRICKCGSIRLRTVTHLSEGWE
ncbi:hypothetical protein SESBI_07448 [Sesbania bispinosa]|nr:hypothetical protein SESBI_07448 [Sesbania bispinosa]